MFSTPAIYLNGTHVFSCIYIHIYIYKCVRIYIHIYIHMYTCIFLMMAFQGLGYSLSSLQCVAACCSVLQCAAV